MKKTLFWLCLLCAIQLSAQDRILTLKQDTLKAKINSIDKQKVIYYLDADKDKKLQEIPVANLHKIIWRTRLEYIINQDFEDKHKKSSNSEKLMRHAVLAYEEKRLSNKLNPKFVKTKF